MSIWKIMGRMSLVLALTCQVNAQDFWYTEPAISRDSGEWVNKFSNNKMSGWSVSRGRIACYIFNQNPYQYEDYGDMKATMPEQNGNFRSFIANGSYAALDTAAATMIWNRSAANIQRLREQDRDMIREFLGMGAPRVVVCYQSVLSKDTLATRSMADRIQDVVNHATWLKGQLTATEFAKVDLALVDAYPAKKSVTQAVWRQGYADLKTALANNNTPLKYLVFDYPANHVMGKNGCSATALLQECLYVRNQLGLVAVWLPSADDPDQTAARTLYLDAARAVKAKPAYYSTHAIEAVAFYDFRGSFPDDDPDAVDKAVPFHFLEVVREATGILDY